MKEMMKYNADVFQFREETLEKILAIINKRKTTLENQPLIFGDSLVEGLPKELKITNNGIGGMTSGVLLNLVDELVIKFKPSKVYLHIGTNDMGDTVMASPRTIALNVKKIFAILKRNLPDTKLHIISTVPCIDEIDSMFTLGRGIRMNALHQKLNEEYQIQLQDMNVEYLDVYQYLVHKDGTVKKEFYKDGLHLNMNGYYHLINIKNPITM